MITEGFNKLAKNHWYLIIQFVCSPIAHRGTVHYWFSLENPHKILIFRNPIIIMHRHVFGSSGYVHLMHSVILILLYLPQSGLKLVFRLFQSTKCLYMYVLIVVSLAVQQSKFKLFFNRIKRRTVDTYGVKRLKKNHLLV